MFVTKYKVTSPQVIEEFIDDLDYQNKALVKVNFLAICKADIRYYLGNREQSVLLHKYPLAPIHEAVGEVVKDLSNNFKKGDKVILVPNSYDESLCKDCKNDRCKDNHLGDNYCPDATFRSSNKDGFMSPFYAAESNILVKYDSSIPEHVAVFSELLSVGYAASRRIDLTDVKEVALFGDGIMGYIVYLVLHYYYNIDVDVYGIDQNKLNCFTYANKCLCSAFTDKKYDVLFECVGGKYSKDAINQMIDMAYVGADLVLMGVSEDLIGVNTRKVLEKGLALKGVTRSSIKDFQVIAKLLENKDLQKDIEKMVLSITKINTIKDIYDVYKKEIDNKTIIGKNLLKF